MTVSLNLGLGQEIWKMSLEFWNTVPESKEVLRCTRIHSHTAHIQGGRVIICLHEGNIRLLASIIWNYSAEMYLLCPISLFIYIDLNP